MKRSDFRAALSNTNLIAFLAVIRKGEGTFDDGGYSRQFGGKQFTSFADHPREVIHASGYASSAAGAFQFLSGTWDNLVRMYGFEDFSPQCQDEGAVALIYGRGALDDVIAGRIEVAIAKCCREWASLPGSPYGQPTRTMAQALATYKAAGGVINAQAPESVSVPEVTPQPPVETRVPVPVVRPSIKDKFMLPLIPIFTALLPTLIESIPRLKALFPGGEVSDRNVKVAEVAFKVAQEALGAANAQQVVQMVQDDPAAAQTVAKAVEDNWWNLTESGGGGIAGAAQRDAAFVSTKAHVWDSPSFVAMVFLVPLIYWIFGGVLGLYGTMKLDPAVTASIITGAVTLVLGSVAGYYFGSTTTKNKPQS